LPSRVIADFGAEYLVDLDGIPRRATARGFDPTVGDWVVLEDGRIVEVLPRRTVISRRAAGEVDREQVLAANVDVVFVIAAATDVNPRRLERYLTIAWQSGAAPVVVLTKADLVEAVQTSFAAAPVIVTSSVTGQGVAAIEEALRPSKTGVFLGPSGVGKSTLINRLAGEDLMATRKVHAGSGEGRHMTSHRQLIKLPGGGMIIDTPGLREAQLWQGEDALAGVFEDIETLAAQCRFNDCTHVTEPGCAVKAALADGSLDHGRFESYRKLQRELRSIAARSADRPGSPRPWRGGSERRKWKQIAVSNRARERYLRR